MTNKNIILNLGFVLLTAACGKVTGLDDGGTGRLDPNQTQKATEQFCSANQKLEVLEGGTDVPFEQLNYRSRVFAFISSDASKKCITEQAVNKTWSDGSWFSLNPLDSCLKNGSIWSVNSSQSGGNTNYALTMIDDPSLRIMHMDGYRLRGTAVSEALGLKVLVCVNK